MFCLLTNKNNAESDFLSQAIPEILETLYAPLIFCSMIYKAYTTRLLDSKNVHQLIAKENSKLPIFVFVKQSKTLAASEQLNTRKYSDIVYWDLLAQILGPFYIFFKSSISLLAKKRNSFIELSYSLLVQDKFRDSWTNKWGLGRLCTTF